MPKVIYGTDTNEKQALNALDALVIPVVVPINPPNDLKLAQLENIAFIDAVLAPRRIVPTDRKL